MSVKKLICNPPAERVAECGDPEVLGLFEGAGKGVYSIDSEEIRNEYVHKVTDIEAEYVTARNALRDQAIGKMHAANEWLFEKLGIAQVG